MKDVTDSHESLKDRASRFFSFKKSKSGAQGPKKPYNYRKLYILLLIALAIYYYILLPPIHYASPQFWLFLLVATGAIVCIEFIQDLSQALIQHGQDKASFRLVFKRAKGKYGLIAGFWLVVLLGGGLAYLILSPVFFASDYSQMLEVEERSFEQDFPETNLSQITLVDRDTAERLGNRHLGALTDLVSQFEAADDYTQINIEGYPYRVTPLEYAGFFRWLNNFRQGIPHYIQVDNVTGEVAIKTPEQPMKYSYSDLFQRDVLRKLRFAYPFTIFEHPSFEVDDQGVPYYVATTYSRNFFIREPEVSGVITLNAITGETQAYDLGNIPTWIDRVYSADLILHQLTMRGRYQNGFWNSLFAQKGVTEPTAGYNYLPIDDDIYLYTGITSVVADDSNIGFVLVNLRTKEAVMYPLTAAEEFSAMQSAEGSVQETSYQATFPLLINIKGKPMYILSLKDNSGLIKEYALVDAQNYQRVYTAPSVERLLALYAEENPLAIEDLPAEEDLETLKGAVDEIQAVVQDGNTVYYFMLDGKVYRARLSLNEALPFLKAGDQVEIKVRDNGQVEGLEIQQ